MSSRKPAPLPRVELGFAAPFDADAVLGHLRAHAIPGAETVQGDTVTRVVPAPSGPVVVTVRLAPTEVSVSVGSSDPADVTAVTAIVRRWFDLDLDPAAVAAVLGPDRVVGPGCG